ncbi:MAG: methylmalonyl Co-A mutase-associated GTPase MeaB [Bryobacterales bacterium]|nr:methylmalonyl Co-A mutase-associated GTPase MeaB [Bryobacterales bacterium]
MQDLAERIRQGDLRALARAATIIENRMPQAEALLRELFPLTGQAVIYGITGPPGAGKSTVTNELVKALRAEGAMVGVLAVDPSSPFSGGAILGDRIRMQQHHADAGVFIRSLATRGSLGGLAAATLELCLLLDAAGRQSILVETVGVGQDEVDIVRLADVTVVVLVPGMGDDVQAIKAGIMEIADVFLINKSDQPGAERLEQEIRAVFATAHQPREIPIVKTVASSGQGITEALAAMRQVQVSKPRQAVQQWERRLRQMLVERLLGRVDAASLRHASEAVAARREDPYTAVARLVETMLGRIR